MGESIFLYRNEDIPICLKCQQRATCAMQVTCLAPVISQICRTCAPHEQRKTRGSVKLGLAGLLVTELQWP